jgi:DNA polymerase III epsilon subunit-like protein
MYAFLDTETTGFASGGVQPRIVSMAWMVADHPDRPRVFKRRVVRPDGFSIPARAAAVHGITTERARAEGLPIAAVLAEFASDLRALRPEAVVAHNARYDLPVVAAEFQRLGVGDPCRDLSILCTVLQCRDAWPGESARLGDVYQRVFGDALRDAHDAGADVRACARIFFHLASKRGGSPARMRANPAQARPAVVGAERGEQRDWGLLVATVLEWAERRTGFDTGFVESLRDRLALGRGLTAGQEAALENIIMRCGIRV